MISNSLSQWTKRRRKDKFIGFEAFAVAQCNNLVTQVDQGQSYISLFILNPEIFKKVEMNESFLVKNLTKLLMTAKTF